MIAQCQACGFKHGILSACGEDGRKPVGILVDRDELPRVSVPRVFADRDEAGTLRVTRGIECSEVTAQLIDQILQRDAHGHAKYGVTLDRDDLCLSDWLQHMAEELMDGAGYALAAKRESDAILNVIVDKAVEAVRKDVDSEDFAAGVDNLATYIRGMIGKPLPVKLPPNYRRALNMTQDQARAMLSDDDYKVAERVLKALNTTFFEFECRP